MRKHLVFTCFAFMIWGASFTLYILDKEIGIPKPYNYIVGSIGLIFYLLATHISVPTIGEFIKKHTEK